MLEQNEINKILEHLNKELQSLRTNRATPTLVANISVEAYGTFTPLDQLASINVPEPRTLVIQPWDKSQLKALAAAIEKSNLDINPVVDQNVVRLNLPALTEEKRLGLVKILKSKLEESRISVRKLREETLKKLKQAEKSGEISEDDYHHQEKEIQEQIKSVTGEIDSLGKKKEQEIMTI